MRNILKKLWQKMPPQFRMAIGKFYNNQLDDWALRSIGTRHQIQRIKTPKVAIIGFVSAAMGHGTAANLLIREIELMGHEVATFDISHFFDVPKDSITNETSFDFSKYDTLIMVVNPDIMPFVIRKLSPNLIKGKRIIGYWAWELEAPPTKWRKISKFVDEIWVPSQFCKDSLSKIFKQEIFVIPHACALNEPPSDLKARGLEFRKSRAIPVDAFVASQSFSMASSMERKNVIGAIQAFSMAFNKSDNAYLIIRYFGGMQFSDTIKRLELAVAKAESNIILISAKPSIDEIEAFYGASNVLISLHRSEGFGLNIAEAILRKIPVIATNYSGNIDFMNEDGSFMVDYELISISDSDKIYNNSDAIWAQANIKTASQSLLKCRNSTAYAQEMAQIALKKAKSTLNGSISKQKLL